MNALFLIFLLSDFYSELAPIDVTVEGSVAPVSIEEQEEAAAEGVEAAQEAAEVAAELGFVAADQLLFEPDVIEILESEAIVDIASTAGPIIPNATDPSTTNPPVEPVTTIPPTPGPTEPVA